MINWTQPHAIAALCLSGYVGWHHGIFLQNAINSTHIKPYKDRVFSFKKDDPFDEKSLCSIATSATGIFIYYAFWPAGLTYSVYYIQKIHPEECRKVVDTASSIFAKIREIIKDISKK